MASPCSFAFPFEFLAPVTIVAGHYGTGKTNLSLNLAADARAKGVRVTLVDLDIVNPYFRSSDHAASLEEQGIRVVSPVFAGSGSNLDVPSLTGAIAPAIEEAWTLLGAMQGESGTSSQTLPPAIVIVDVGGDDAGACALGRFACDVSAGPYAFLYVVNRFRNLTQTPNAAAEALAPIQDAARLRATAVVNNSHLMEETDWACVEAGLSFGEETARLAGLPLACTTLPQTLACRENGGIPSFVSGRRMYSVQRYVRTPWEMRVGNMGSEDKEGATWHE